MQWEAPKDKLEAGGGLLGDGAGDGVIGETWQLSRQSCDGDRYRRVWKLLLGVMGAYARGAGC